MHKSKSFRENEADNFFFILRYKWINLFPARISDQVIIKQKKKKKKKKKRKKKRKKKE